jgi:hypothetical protein
LVISNLVHLCSRWYQARIKNLLDQVMLENLLNQARIKNLLDQVMLENLLNQARIKNLLNQVRI